MNDIIEPLNEVTIRTKSGNFYTYTLEQSEIPTSIDINNIIKCKNIEYLVIVFAVDPKPDIYIHNYESLAELQKMYWLKIHLNGYVTRYGTQTTDQITDISFFEEMPNLIYIDFQNIALPDDLSSLCTSPRKSIALRGCGITYDAFQNLGDNLFRPESLFLEY